MQRIVVCSTLLACGMGVPMLSASVARACSKAAPVAFQVDPALRASDTTPPDPFTALSASVRRSPESSCRNGQCTSTSCGSSGIALIKFEMPEQAQTDDTLGYRIVWLRGSIPPPAVAALSSVWPLGSGVDGRAQIAIELGFDDVEDLDAEVALVAVDRAGNESQPSEPVHLEFSGCTIDLSTGECAQPLSCSAGVAPRGMRPSGWPTVVTLACLAVAAFVVRRKKRRG